MSKFKVGDIVRGTRGKYSYTNEGMTRGEVVETFEPRGISNDDMRVKILTAPHYVGCTFPVESKHFELVKPVKEFIVIRRDNRDVIASHKRGNEIVKTAKATCAPSDEFNFDTGAKLAFDRLMGREEPLYNCIGSATVSTQPALKFKVGDRVVGQFGTGEISACNSVYTNCYLVYFPYLIGGHSGHLPSGIASKPEHKDHCKWQLESELSPAPEPKYYAGKVRATGVRGTALETGKNESNSFIYDRIGVVYEFINGECERLGMHHTHNFDEIVKVCDCSTWHEVKE